MESNDDTGDQDPLRALEILAANDKSLKVTPVLSLNPSKCGCLQG